MAFVSVSADSTGSVGCFLFCSDLPVYQPPLSCTESADCATVTHVATVVNSLRVKSLDFYLFWCRIGLTNSDTILYSDHVTKIFRCNGKREYISQSAFPSQPWSLMMIHIAFMSHLNSCLCLFTAPCPESGAEEGSRRWTGQLCLAKGKFTYSNNMSMSRALDNNCKHTT